MSFQGDVAGIGLGELLQGLARGGRDGVLTLDGEEGLSSILGLANGQIHFLPGPTEDTDTWRERCQRAWADSPDANLENKRRVAIAHSARREMLFRTLEAANLHFRFEPGALPNAMPSLAREDGLGGAAQTVDKPWGPGYPVEYLLLDHARIQDEAMGSLARDLAPGDMPRALGAAEDESVRIFLGQCDGASTLEEISDRLGWPVRQTRGVVGQHMAAGNIRIADHRELLVAAQSELQSGRIGRASTRLARWVELAPPGPLFQEGEAELLIGEWQAERLILALNLMSPRGARAIMRRLDFVSADRTEALTRWQALAQCRRRDAIIAFKCAVLSACDVPSEASEAAGTDLLQLARSLQDRECPWRARAVLRLAATQVHEKLSARLEIGGRLIQVGLAPEASPIIVAAARELLESGQAEKAIPALRALVAADANQREAAGLLIRARAHKTNVRRRRRNAVIGLAIVVVISAAAVVQLQVQRRYDRLLAEVTDSLNQPDTALTLLDEYFGDDDSPRVVALRVALEERQLELARRERETWLAQFESVEQEMETGDPLRGLRRAMELGKPEELALPQVPGDWPSRRDLFGILAKRLESAAGELHAGIDATAEEERDEGRLLELLANVLREVADGDAVEGIDNLEFFVRELQTSIEEQRERRATERRSLETKQLEEQQDMMLAAARAHSQAGDLRRAVSMYDRLLTLSGSEELVPLLAGEVQEVRRHHEALERALGRAQAGDHTGARSELQGICPKLSEHALPFRVESLPSGARATLRNGSVRVTPFVLDSYFGEELELTFALDGCEPHVVKLTDPRDLLVHMYRLPERFWAARGRVEAAPVAVADDHILADRSGTIARLDRNGGTAWSIHLESLGGIARTPVFLPRRPGHLLVLAEDGRAWLVDSANGSAEGPFDMAAPPVEGPVITRNGVSARFEDGRVAQWNDKLEPQIFKDSVLFEASSLSAGSGDRASLDLAILRRSAAAGTSLPAPWSEWVVEVESEFYRVVRTRGLPGTFTVRRQGAWSLVAWESPNALVSDGRLWIADEAGIRSFRPLQNAR